MFDKSVLVQRLSASLSSTRIRWIKHEMLLLVQKDKDVWTKVMNTECVQRFDLISHCVTIDAQGSSKEKQNTMA